MFWGQTQSPGHFTGFWKSGKTDILVRIKSGFWIPKFAYEPCQWSSEILGQRSPPQAESEMACLPTRLISFTWYCHINYFNLRIGSHNWNRGYEININTSANLTTANLTTSMNQWFILEPNEEYCMVPESAEIRINQETSTSRKIQIFYPTLLNLPPRIPSHGYLGMGLHYLMYLF